MSARNKELAVLARSLMPTARFNECDENGNMVEMVSTLALPQHPICITGPSKDYADMIELALNLLARVYE